MSRGVLYTREEAEGTRLKNPFDTITEGIGLNRLTANFAQAHIDGAFKGSDREAVEMAAHLLRCNLLESAVALSPLLLIAALRLGAASGKTTLPCTQNVARVDPFGKGRGLLGVFDRETQEPSAFQETRELPAALARDATPPATSASTPTPCNHACLHTTLLVCAFAPPVAHRSDALFVGSSAAMNCVGAVKAARLLGPGHTIVTLLCDGGQRHLSKFHNAEYLSQYGLTPQATADDGLKFVE